MATAMERLATEVEENKTVTGSAVALLVQLNNLLKDAIASGNMQEVQRLADSLDSTTNALAAAVTANTPVEGNEPPPETPSGPTEDPVENNTGSSTLGT